MDDCLQVIRIFADSAMLILIWLVQLIIYPAFRSVDPELFSTWHRQYMKTISFFVIPLMLLQASCIGFQLIGEPDAVAVSAAVAVLAAWLVTFAISAPCHQRLQQKGKEEALIARLISTNWIRTVSWSLAWLTGIMHLTE